MSLNYLKNFLAGFCLRILVRSDLVVVKSGAFVTALPYVFCCIVWSFLCSCVIFFSFLFSYFPKRFYFLNFFYIFIFEK